MTEKTISLDQETAESIIRLTRTASADFNKFLEWFDKVHMLMTARAVQGIDDKHSPDVLRGRAQALSILKMEIEKAPNLVGRIQKPSAVI